MSCNSRICGYSLKLNENLQNMDKLKEISEILGYSWDDDCEWDEIMFSEWDKYINKWKPHKDYFGNLGFIYTKDYEYDADDVIFYCEINEIELALKDYIDKTNIIPDNNIKSFAIIYYNGSDCPFKY
jgi:hypothetical protein